MSKQRKKELLEQNNELREKLYPENKQYYEKLLSYMRLGSFFHDPIELEELLLEILQDTVDAQENGDSARDFFGVDAKTAADDCLARIEMKKSEGVKLFGIVLLMSVFLTSMRGLVQPEEGINFVSIFAQILLYSTVIGLFFRWVRKSIYKKTFLANNIFGPIIIAAGMLLFIVPVVLIELLSPESWSVYPSPTIAIGVSILLSIAATIKFVLLPKEEKKAWSGMLPIAWMYTALTILNHWAPFAEWMQEYPLFNGFFPLIFIAICMIINFRVINKEETPEIFEQ